MGIFELERVDDLSEEAFSLQARNEPISAWATSLKVGRTEIR